MEFRTPHEAYGPWYVSLSAHDDPGCFERNDRIETNIVCWRLTDDLRDWVKANTLREPLILAHPFGASITFYDRAEWVMFKFRFYGGAPTP